MVANPCPPLMRRNGAVSSAASTARSTSEDPATTGARSIASVRKGEHGTFITFWKSFVKEDENGERKTIPMLKHFHVFNVAQCDGLDFSSFTYIWKRNL